MSVLIRNMNIPKDGQIVLSIDEKGEVYIYGVYPTKLYKAIELPPHGDLIDRDALIKDGWLNLHKEVIRMGGYSIHELPLKNPTIPVIIEAEAKE